MDIVNKLPTELKKIIWSHVNINIKVWVCKYYYEKYHNTIILKEIPEFHKYIISLIIKKENYIFNIIYKHTKMTWKIRNCHYSKMTYDNAYYLTYDSYLKHKALKYNNKFVLELIKGKSASKYSCPLRRLTCRGLGTFTI